MNEAAGWEKRGVTARFSENFTADWVV